jgi:hypothetical protein
MLISADKNPTKHLSAKGICSAMLSEKMGIVIAEAAYMAAFCISGIR